MKIPIPLVDATTQMVVEAELFDDINESHFRFAHEEWSPLVNQAAAAMFRKGMKDKLPEHNLWNWVQKGLDSNLLGVQFYGISCCGELQGLMKVQLTGMMRCRLPEQINKECIYIDYLQSAPWNVKPYMEVLQLRQKYMLVGTRLMEAAVYLSINEGFDGRLGLHSLSKAEDFYRKHKMTELQKDPKKQNMIWFEFTPEQSRKFINGDMQ